jgi:hypothetical protein
MRVVRITTCAGTPVRRLDAPEGPLRTGSRAHREATTSPQRATTGHNGRTNEPDVMRTIVIKMRTIVINGTGDASTGAARPMRPR